MEWIWVQEKIYFNYWWSSLNGGCNTDYRKNYSINFREHNKKFCLSLHYNGANSYFSFNGTEIHKFKAKDSEVNAIPLCLRKVSKNFFVDNIEKTGFYAYVYDCSFDYDAIAVDDILDIPKYLMKKNSIK